MINKLILSLLLFLAFAAGFIATVDFSLGHVIYAAWEVVIAIALLIGFCLVAAIIKEGI